MTSRIGKAIHSFPDRTKYPLLTVQERFILDTLSNWITLDQIILLLPKFKYIRIKWTKAEVTRTLRKMYKKKYIDKGRIGWGGKNIAKVYGNKTVGQYFRIREKWRYLL